MVTLFVLRAVGYLPHRRLLTTHVRSWLFVLALAAGGIAVLEALFFAHITAELSHNQWAGAVVGVVWAMLTFSFDRYVALSDTGPGKSKLKVIAGILFRAGGMLLLFLLVAPQAKYFTVDTEVDNYLHAQESRVRAEWRAKHDAAAQREIEQARQKVLELESALTLEISGQGLSGRHGEGPTANSIRRQLERHRTQLEGLERSASDERAMLDQLSNEELAARYGLSFPGNGLAERRRVAARLLAANPSYEETATLSKSLVAVLFLIFVATKLMQGHAVGRYLSSVWQSRYSDYLAGAFNEYLAHYDLPDVRPMDADRFQDWYEANGEIVVARSNPALQQETEPATLAEAIDSEIDAIESEINALSVQMDCAQKTESRLTGDRMRLAKRLATLTGNIQRKSNKHAQLQSGKLLEDTSPSDRAMLKLMLEGEIEAAQHDRADIEAEIMATEVALTTVRADRKDLGVRFTELSALQTHALKTRDGLRSERLNVYARRAAVIPARLLRKDKPHETRVLQ